MTSHPMCSAGLNNYFSLVNYLAVQHSKRNKLDLNHPAIQRVIKQTQPAQASSDSTTIDNPVGDITPGIGDAALAALVEETNGDLTDGSNRPETPQTPMLNGEISELLSSCSTPDSEKLSLSDSQDLPALPGAKGPRNTGEVCDITPKSIGALLSEILVAAVKLCWCKKKK